MSTTDLFLKAAHAYRENPSVVGHQETEAKRNTLRLILSLVSSQAMLQESIKTAEGYGYYDKSLGTKHLWCRLRKVENQLRELESTYGQTIKAREYFTGDHEQDDTTFTDEECSKEST